LQVEGSQDAICNLVAAATIMKYPNLDPRREYPIIVSLHGAGEAGTGSTGPATHVPALRLAARAKDPRYANFVLVPQTSAAYPQQ
jgi:predicted peptidase